MYPDDFGKVSWHMITPVILCGGSGTRLWPLSRELYPKQLLPLVDQQTMLQNTAQRLSGIGGLAPLIAVSNEEHRFLLAEQLREINAQVAGILLEPVGRNTAPAVAVAALFAMSHGDDPLLLVLPADHAMQNPSAFRQAVERAVPFAELGKLITFGVVPTGPETGYGYIKAGEELGAGGCHVERFVEKPDRDTAEQMLADGGYYWNSGMFLFKASVYLKELEQYRPDILEACRKTMDAAEQSYDFVRLGKAAFMECPGDSIDYAVMEKTPDAVVIPLDAGWSDVGSWSSLHEAVGPDQQGNVLSGDVLIHDVQGCYITSNHRLVAAVGLQDHIIVETADAVLVAQRDKVQDVKAIVQQLNAAGRPETLHHRRVTRPWGAYESIDASDRFQVKRITVVPGASLSLQLHHHRAEHWIVVSGTAKITRGDETFVLSENESTYIPLGVVHRLANPGKIPLELIEVQSGSYLGEDDIVRLDDTYGR